MRRVILRSSSTSFRKFARAITSSRPSPPGHLVHCQGGRDRTGLSSPLLSAWSRRPRDYRCRSRPSDVSWGRSSTRGWPRPFRAEREPRRRSWSRLPDDDEGLAEVERIYGGPRVPPLRLDARKEHPKTLTCLWSGLSREGLHLGRQQPYGAGSPRMLRYLERGLGVPRPEQLLIPPVRPPRAPTAALPPRLRDRFWAELTHVAFAGRSTGSPSCGAGRRTWLAGLVCLPSTCSSASRAARRVTTERTEWHDETAHVKDLALAPEGLANRVGRPADSRARCDPRALREESPRCRLTASRLACT